MIQSYSVAKPLQLPPRPTVLSLSFFFLKNNNVISSLHNFQLNRRKQIRNNRGMWSWPF